MRQIVDKIDADGKMVVWAQGARKILVKSGMFYGNFELNQEYRLSL